MSQQFAAAGSPPAVTPRLFYDPHDKYILVVDDDVVTRMLIDAFLRSYGFNVTLCEDGRQAWECLARGQRFDVALVDCRMPHMDGFDLLQHITAHPVHMAMPVVLMSAAGDCVTADKSIHMGSSDYLMKPISRELLKRRIDNCVLQVVSAEKHAEMQRFLNFKTHECTELQQQNDILALNIRERDERISCLVEELEMLKNFVQTLKII